MFKIVSSDKKIDYIKSHMKNFISEMENKLDEGKFNKILYSYRMSLSEPFSNIYDEYDYFLEKIKFYGPNKHMYVVEDFLKTIDEKHITFNGFKNFIKNYISNNDNNFFVEIV